jgi:ABC-type bacteriocin/lantibiotic exporter with double-glycine peptidase domain
MKNLKPPPPDLGDEIIELENFPVYKQQTDHTCGPCAARMALEYMGLKVSEEQLARRCLTHPWGTLHWTVALGFDFYARKLGFRVRMMGDAPDVFERMLHNLRRQIPTLFLYAVEDHFHPPKKVTHYGNLVGVNGPAGTVSVANPFGLIEKMDASEWWARFSLDAEYMPADQMLLLPAGILKPRTIFLLMERI